MGEIPETLPDENPALYRCIIAKRALLASYEDTDEPGPCLTDLLGDSRAACQMPSRWGSSRVTRGDFAAYLARICRERGDKIGTS